MHWVTSSLDPETFTDLSLEPGMGEGKMGVILETVFWGVKIELENGILEQIKGSAVEHKSSFHVDLTFNKSGGKAA